MFCCPGWRFWLAPMPLFLAPSTTLKKYRQAQPWVLAKVYGVLYNLETPNAHSDSDQGRGGIAKRGAKEPGSRM